MKAPRFGWQKATAATIEVHVVCARYIGVGYTVIVGRPKNDPSHWAVTCSAVHAKKLRLQSKTEDEARTEALVYVAHELRGLAERATAEAQIQSAQYPLWPIDGAAE